MITQKELGIERRLSDIHDKLSVIVFQTSVAKRKRRGWQKKQRERERITNVCLRGRKVVGDRRETGTIAKSVHW